MKKMPWIILVMYLVAAGCVAHQDDVVMLDYRLASLEERNTELEKRAESLEQEKSKLESELSVMQQKEQAKNRGLMDQSANISVTLEQLRNDIRILTGKLEETEFNLNRRIKALENAERQRLADMEGLHAARTQDQDRLGRLEQYLDFESNRKTAVSRSVSAKTRTAQTVYDNAKNAFDANQLDEAREGFQEFITRYPKNENADNAQYWLGEILYREEMFGKAILAYQKVIDDYPRGNKVPAALLKQGLAFWKLGDKANARLILRELIRKYAATPQAQIAKDKLKGLK